MTTKWKGYLACIFFLHSLHDFKPGGEKGNITGVRGIKLDKVISSLLLFMSLLSRVLLPALANTEVHYGSILWTHYLCFTFHFSVNGKRAMAVFGLRWEDPNLMMLRNLRTLSVALGLCSVYVTAAFSSYRTQQTMSGFCNNRLKEGEDEILVWSLLACFVTFYILPKNQK